MVQHHKLWLTNIHYQNDSKEYYYAFKLVRNILIKEYNGLAINFLKGFKNKVSSVFTFSLSEKRDLLSQWRGYCPKGGFSLSFDRRQFNEVIKQEKLIVGRCLYDKVSQRNAVIQHVIGFTSKEYSDACQDTKQTMQQLPPEMFYFGKHLFESISQIAPLLKHSSFAGEKEWRVFKVVQTSSEAKSLAQSAQYYFPEGLVKVRPRQNMLIPYIEVPMLDEKGLFVNISKVFISPTPHKKLALDSCGVALHPDKSINYGVVVRNSKIPYVNW